MGYGGGSVACVSVCEKAGGGLFVPPFLAEARFRSPPTPRGLRESPPPPADARYKQRREN